MFCTQCGTKLPDDARFCTGCGAPVAPKAATQAPAPAEAQAAEPTPAEAPAADPGETVVTLDAVEPTSENAAAVEAAAETVTDPGETVVTLDAVDADPGETVVTLDAAEPSAGAEAEAAAPADPGETVVTLDAVNPEAPADTADPAAGQTDPGETVVTLDAVEPSAEQTAEPQATTEPAADPKPAAESIVDDAAPVDAAEAEEIFETDDNAAVAVAFPGDDAAVPAAADDPTTLVNVNDDPTTIAEFDEDAQATAEAMESLGVAHPTAGATVVDLPQQQMTGTTMQAAPIPQPQPQPQMPMPQQPQQKKRRWPVFAGLGLVAAGAAVAAILLLTPNANAVEITSGSQDAVVCTVDTKVLPKKKDRVIHSYTATLTPKNGGKSYKIKVKGDDGFTIGDFGKVKPGDYSCKIEDTKGNTVQNFNTTVVKKDDASAEKPAESVTVNTPKKDDDASSSTDNSNDSSSTTSKDDASDDSTSTDDSTTEDDSSTSSDSTSSSKPSKSDKKTDTSKGTANTTAPATIDDATYKAACTAYKSKLNSLIKKYGEPELVSTGSSDYQISGVQFAQLVDFNGDGLEELVTVHSKTKAKSFNKKTRLSNGDYVLDVWGYNGKKVVNLYSGSPEASNGGYVFVTFKTMIGDTGNHVYLPQLVADDTAVLVGDDAEPKYFTYDGTEFKAAEGELHGDNFDDQSAFLIKGYSDNLEDQDATAPENAIDTSKLNLNNTVDTVEQTLMALNTKISGTDTDADASGSKSSDSSSSKSSSSKKSSKSSKSSSSSKSYSYDDSDDSDYDSDDSDYDYDDSYDDSSDYDDSTDSVPPTEFTDVDE